MTSSTHPVNENTTPKCICNKWQCETGPAILNICYVNNDKNWYKKLILFIKTLQKVWLENNKNIYSTTFSE